MCVMAPVCLWEQQHKLFSDTMLPQHMTLKQKEGNWCIFAGTELRYLKINMTKQQKAVELFLSLLTSLVATNPERFVKTCTL